MGCFPNKRNIWPLRWRANPLFKLRFQNFRILRSFRSSHYPYMNATAFFISCPLKIIYVWYWRACLFITQQPYMLHVPVTELHRTLLNQHSFHLYTVHQQHLIFVSVWHKLMPPLLHSEPCIFWTVNRQSPNEFFYFRTRSPFYLFYSNKRVQTTEIV